MADTVVVDEERGGEALASDENVPHAEVVREKTGDALVETESDPTTEAVGVAGVVNDKREVTLSAEEAEVDDVPVDERLLDAVALVDDDDVMMSEAVLGPVVVGNGVLLAWLLDDARDVDDRPDVADVQADIKDDAVDSDDELAVAVTDKEGKAVALGVTDTVGDVERLAVAEMLR